MQSVLCIMAMVVIAANAAPSKAAITFDASAEHSANSDTTSWQHTVGPGLDRVLVVGVSIFSGNKIVNSITYGGATFTIVGPQNGGSGSDNRRVEIWLLVNPPVGTGDIIVAMSGGSKTVFGSASYFGVDPLAPNSPFSSAQGIGTAASITVASAPDQLVFDVIATKGSGGTITPGAGQTELWNGNTGTNRGAIMGGGSHQIGSASTVMSWTLGASEYWVAGAISLLPAPPRPFLVDAMIKLASEPDAAYRLDAIYETTASLQVAADGGVNSTTISYTIRFENDGFSSDQFVITGTAGDALFTVQYLDGAGVDRTADVTGGGYTDILLASGGSTVWTLNVTPVSSVPGGTSYPVAVTATSVGDPLVIDQIAAVTTALSPALSMTKSVDLVSAAPEQDLTYSIIATTAPSLADATAVVVVDPVPSDVGFQVGSATFDPGTTGLTSTIAYSDDNGATWVYIPGTGLCGAPGGYDYCVTHVRWELSGLMPAAQTFSVAFVGHVK